MLSTLLSIFEYILTFTNNNTLVSTLSTISSQNSLEAQIMYINLYANLYSFGLISDTDVTNLKSEINELDSMASSIPFTIKTQITYSDGSNQSMILSFAIDKMISQAQLLASASNVLANDSSLFFVQYNSVNGLEYGCELALSTSQS
jgi:predicted metalloendopeptidase